MSKNRSFQEPLDGEDKGESFLKSRKLRSPCLDAHYEAYLLRSRWTVGNLYASNLYLGQTHVKHVHDINKQQKHWLLGKEREQQKMAKRMGELTAVKNQNLERNTDIRKPKGNSSGPTLSRHVSLETLGKQPQLISAQSRSLLRLRMTRSISQPCKPPLLSVPSIVGKERLDADLPENFNGRFPARDSSKTEILFGKHFSRLPQRLTKTPNGSTSRPGGAQRVMASRTSVSATRVTTVPRAGHVVDPEGSRFMPRWVPMAFRLQNIRGGNNNA